MKKHIFAAFAAGILAAAASPALAADGSFSPTTFYGNLGGTIIHDGADSVNLGAIQGRLGARFGQYIGAEGEVAFGVSDDTEPTFGAKIKMKSEYAAYAVGYIPVSPKADIFARIGYGHVNVSAELLGVSASQGADSVNYGGGAQYFFDQNNGIRAEYTRYDLRKGYSGVDAWSLSYVRKF
jgi:outer membrane immunogenic protein